MEETYLGFKDETHCRVLQVKPNGGGVIEWKLATETYDIISARTQGGGTGRKDLTVEMLRQMVENFGRLPGPMPFYVSHVDEFTKEVMPAAGFINRIWLDGQDLMAELDCGPQIFQEIMMDGWRGASIEFGRNVKATTGDIPGWSLVGLAITNTPALDVVNKIAAGIAPIAAVHLKSGATNSIVRLSLAKETDEEHNMNLEQALAKIEELTKALEAKEAEIEKLNATHAEEVTKLSKENEDLDSIRQRAREYTKLTADYDTLKSELEKQTTINLNRDIREIVETALELGKITPAEVAGYAENPVLWLSKSFGETFTPIMLENLYSKRSKIVNTTDKKSSGYERNTSTLSRELTSDLKKLGLNPDYANVTNAADARRIAERK